MIRFRPAFRRLALALAAAQLLAYGAAPALEAATERSPGPVALEPAHGQTCSPIHQPATCLACQLLNAHARRPEPSGVRVPMTEPLASPGAETTPAAPCGPPPTHHTRAPPAPPV